jgi:hypothetical protein
MIAYVLDKYSSMTYPVELLVSRPRSVLGGLCGLIANVAPIYDRDGVGSIGNAVDCTVSPHRSKMYEQRIRYDDALQPPTFVLPLLHEPDQHKRYTLFLPRGQYRG